MKRELSSPPKSDDKCELSLDKTDAVELKDDITIIQKREDIKNRKKKNISLNG